MRRILVLVLMLAACTPGADAPTVGGDQPAGIGADQIEVTALDAPGSAPPETAPPETATLAEAATPETAATAPDTAAPATAVPVAEATAATPHPQPRPDGADPAAASGEATAPPAEIQGEIQGEVSTPPPDEPKSTAQIRCEAGGGVWGSATEGGPSFCQKRTRDSGKICKRKQDCEGECLAASGTCAPVTPLLGCNEVLDGKGRAMTLCLD